MKTPKTHTAKIAINILLPVPVVEYLYNMMEQEEKAIGIKRNLSAVIYRSLSSLHTDMPKFDIDKIYSKRRRGIDTAEYKVTETPIIALLSKEEQDKRMMEDMQKYAIEQSIKEVARREQLKKEGKSNE